MITNQTVMTNATCGLYFDRHQAETIAIIRGGSGLLTFFVAIVTLIVILAIKAYKLYANRLFLYLTIATLLHAPTYELEVITINYQTIGARQPFCTISGIYSMYISWLQNLIVLWITCYLFSVVVMRRIFTSKKIELAVGLTILIVPIPAALIPINKYGLAGAWCWIKSINESNNCTEIDQIGLIFQYTLWFVPVVLELITLAILTVTMIIILCARGFIIKKYYMFQYEYRRLLRDSLPLLVFPVIFCFINCFQLTLYVRDNNNKPIMPLWIANAVITPCKGILMILSYLVPIICVRIKDWRKNRLLALRKDKLHDSTRSLQADGDSVRFLSSGDMDNYGSVSIQVGGSKQKHLKELPMDN
jgi:hypothetical protein